MKGKVRAGTVPEATGFGEVVVLAPPWDKTGDAVRACGNLLDPRYPEGAATMFLCGDDARAKATAATLASDLGFDPVDAGPLSASRLLEPLAMLWITLAYPRGMGRDIAFRLMRR